MVACEIVKPETIAVGLLERMWHVAIDSAPRGDIGKIDDETLAELIGWMGDASELIELLVDTGWLDRCENHRLIVHDWPDHAPGFIKKNIARRGGFAVKSSSREPFSGGKTAHVSHSGPTPNRTEHNPTKPNKTKAAEPPDFLSFDNDEAFWSMDPMPGWTRFDWTAAGNKFVQLWKSLPSNAVNGTSYSQLTEIQQRQFEELWHNSEWRQCCREAFAKINRDGRMKCGVKLSLSSWLADAAVADKVVNGTYDFDPARKDSTTGDSEEDDPFKPRLTKAQLEYRERKRQEWLNAKK